MLEKRDTDNVTEGLVKDKTLNQNLPGGGGAAQVGGAECGLPWMEGVQSVVE